MMIGLGLFVDGMVFENDCVFVVFVVLVVEWVGIF